MFFFFFLAKIWKIVNNIIAVPKIKTSVSQHQLLYNKTTPIFPEWSIFFEASMCGKTVISSVSAISKSKVYAINLTASH